ncbi:MAG TPA: hypothetical protein VJ019_07385 [Aestuariivirga sp.]|nr:hypothetical protein [Aestuariivirga sp.]
MTIMAFALNLDPAYVAAYQVARYIGSAYAGGNRFCVALWRVCQSRCECGRRLMGEVK